MFSTIIAATDGSAAGDLAVQTAQELAEVHGSRVVVVHVVQYVGGKGGVYPAAADEDELRARIDSQVSAMKNRGLSAELAVHDIRLGGPAHVIAEEAKAVGAELIVVGGKGHAALTQVFLGSVPLRLLQTAHCPVLVVPAADR